MAKSDLIKALIESHFEEDTNRFNTLALQIAAQEASIGHTMVASDIKSLINYSWKKRPIQATQLPGMDDLIIEIRQKRRLSELVASDSLKNQIGKILLEYRQRDTLQHHGMSFRRKILLAGPPGTGKTMTASVISTELQLPLYLVQIDQVVQKYMGETNAKLRQVFDIIRQNEGVYFFDEFDAIGGERAKDNDVGEMRRVVNAFLQFLENDHSDSYIIAATNNIKLLDSALFRRFDDIFIYQFPSMEEAKLLITNTLGTFLGKQKITDLPSSVTKISQAELTQICTDTIKETILAGEKTVRLNILHQYIEQKLTFQNLLTS